MFAKSAKSANVSKNSDEPTDADAMAAEGRRLLEAAKTAPSGVQILPNGEIVEDPAPGSRVDLRNRGNRLLEQARALRLSQAEKRESPPEQPDKTPDIPSTTPAETQSATDTWADKTPDIANAPPAIKPLSPLDSDIIEYLSRVATTATDDEVHRQVNRGQQGRTLAMTRIALHKLVRAGLVDKINGQYRLAGARP